MSDTMSIVLGVPVLKRYDLLAKFLASVEQSAVVPDLVVVVDNGGRYDGRTTLPQHVIAPGRNLGVAAAWNLIIERAKALDAERIVIANDDIELHKLTLTRVLDEHADVVRAPGFALFSIKPHVVDCVGWFDENLFPAYCVTPDTPILTDELTWVPLGDLRVGSGLIGVDEEALQRNYGGRRYVRTWITRLTPRRSDVVRIVLEDGREVRCTSDHRWLSKPPARTECHSWRCTRELRAGYYLHSPLNVWSTRTDYDGGWFAGILDGEGSLRVSGNTTHCGVQFAQKPGAVLDKARRILTASNIPYTWRINKQDVAHVEINVRRYVFETLGSFRPVRLLRSKIWEDKFLRSRDPNITKPNRNNMVKIERIEPAGSSDIVSIETTSRTFLANGLVSHNCEDNDMTRRLRLNGTSIADPQGILISHVGSATLHSMPMSKQHEFGKRFEELRAYYVSKWGGLPDHETFTMPFDGHPPPGWMERPITVGHQVPEDRWFS